MEGRCNYCPDVWEGWAQWIIWDLILTFLHFYTLEELMSPTEDDLADISLFKTLLIFILWASSWEWSGAHWATLYQDKIRSKLTCDNKSWHLIWKCQCQEPGQEDVRGDFQPKQHSPSTDIHQTSLLYSLSDKETEQQLAGYYDALKLRLWLGDVLWCMSNSDVGSACQDKTVIWKRRADPHAPAQCGV